MKYIAILLGIMILIIGLLIYYDNVEAQSRVIIREEPLTTPEAKDVARETGKVKETIIALEEKIKDKSITHEELGTWIALKGGIEITNFSGNIDDLLNEILK